MQNLFKQLDAVLRGDATRMTALRQGHIDINIRQVSIAVIAAAAFAGLCMGSYAVVRGGSDGLLQLLASAVKLPMLFILTLLVTFPSLYVFNALVGSRLTWTSVMRLLVAANGVMLAVFASLGPIIVFFGLSTTSYPFMKMLNVLAAGVGGVLGLAFLLRTLHRLILVQEARDQADAQLERNQQADALGNLAEEGQASDAESEAQVGADSAAGESESSEGETASTQGENEGQDETEGEANYSRVQQYLHAQTGQADPTSALERLDTAMPDKARTVFRVWVVVYAIVGAQMGWVLRPFIGAPGMKFTLFRDRESNFFLDFFETLARLFGG